MWLLFQVLARYLPVIQAHFILGEQIFAGQIIGTVLVIAGVLMIGWKRKEI